MSHVVLVDMHVTDLDALAESAPTRGLELVRDQTTHRWYGRHVGDYPLPEGFKREDMGKCEHVLRIPGDDSAYEIGVVRRRDGKPGYALMYDFYGRGRALKKCIGENGELLRQAYAAAITKKQLARLGGHLTTTTTETGALLIETIGGRGGPL